MPKQSVAPYNFVPCDYDVLFPGDPERVSHDVPFSDGICGSIDVEIAAATPFFVRGSGDRTRFFGLPDGRPAIPGTSIRGMLRNVVEIASFGKLGRVNDHVFSVRDLSVSDRDYYRGPMANVNAGWLRRSPDAFYDDEDAGEDGSPVWEIEPRQFAMVEYRVLREYARTRKIPDFDPGVPGRRAREKYEAWGEATWPALDVSATVDEGKVQTLGGAGDEAGRLVLTGQPPGRGRNAKHHDFFFYGESGQAYIRVPFDARCAFSQVHSGSGEQHKLDSKPNVDWEFWLRRLNKDERVPVFFLLDKDGQVTALGLARMFRLPGVLSVHAAVKNAQQDAFSDQPDLAELIFGRVSGTGSGADALRGRVSIEVAILQAAGEELAEKSCVLSAPRASFFPNYLAQGDGVHGRNGSPWKTYQDRDAEIRGWKRYPQREREGSLGDAPPTNLDSRFRPLDRGSRFHTRIHVHNLRPFELGAVLWALDFGGRKECRHGLGLAKPFGYGSVKVKVLSHSLNTVVGTVVEDLAEVSSTFEGYMEGERPGWSASATLFALISMATPVPDGMDGHLRHMGLSPNEFNEVKTSGYALKPAGDQEEFKRIARENRDRIEQAMFERRATGEKAAREKAEKEERARLAAMSPEERCFSELEEARRASRHLQLLRSWMEESGGMEPARKAAAGRMLKELFGKKKPSKKWMEKNSDLWNWSVS